MKLLLLAVLVVGLSQAVVAQTTEFSYQGQLQVSGATANGVFDFEFSLFESAIGGPQVGRTAIRVILAWVPKT